MYILFRDLEQVVGSLSSPPGAMLLYNTSFLTQESTSDRQALYTPLVSSHKWLDKVLIINCTIFYISILKHFDNQLIEFRYINLVPMLHKF